MSTVDTTSSWFDTVKLILALAVLSAGIYAFYYYEEQFIPLYRVLALVGVVIVALLICYQTVVGKTMWAYLQDSRTELRKVVWPTRTETVQTTLIVSVMVVIAGVFLWLLDLLFGLASQWLLAL